MELAQQAVVQPVTAEQAGPAVAGEDAAEHDGIRQVFFAAARLSHCTTWSAALALANHFAEMAPVVLAAVTEPAVADVLLVAVAKLTTMNGLAIHHTPRTHVATPAPVAAQAAVAAGWLLAGKQCGAAVVADCSAVPMPGAPTDLADVAIPPPANCITAAVMMCQRTSTAFTRASHRLLNKVQA